MKVRLPKLFYELFRQIEIGHSKDVNPSLSGLGRHAKEVFVEGRLSRALETDQNQPRKGVEDINELLVTEQRFGVLQGPPLTVPTLQVA